jgi:hypothetical protein
MISANIAIVWPVTLEIGCCWQAGKIAHFCRLMTIITPVLLCPNFMDDVAWRLVFCRMRSYSFPARLAVYGFLVLVIVLMLAIY